MGFNEGQLVIMPPNKFRENGLVGKVVKLEENLSKLCNENVCLVERIDGKKTAYYASDLKGVGDELAGDIIDEICEDGRYFVTDNGNKWVLYVDDLYYCEDCNEVHNSLDSAEMIKPYEEPTEEKESDMFMVGYLECLSDIADWFECDDDDKDTIIYKALHDIGIGVNYISDLEKKDYSRFYSLVMKYKEQAKNKPKLTLADIKEKLGYDFELVD